MGGALGGVLFTRGTVLSTAAELLGQDAAEEEYYQSMAAAAETQARLTQENAARNARYIVEDAAYQNNELLRDYSSLLGRQKTALAASGLTSASATAQMILKNSRLNALLDQEMLNENLEREIYENNFAANVKMKQQYTQAQQYRRAEKLRPSWWSKMGGVLGGLFSGRGY